MNVIKQIEQQALLRHPHAKEDRLIYEGVLLRRQLSEYLDILDSLQAPPNSIETVSEGLPLHVTYTYDPENRLGSSRLVKAVQITGAYVRGVNILDVMDDMLISLLSNEIDERINK